jgi:hypothetical protein
VKDQRLKEFAIIVKDQRLKEFAIIMMMGGGGESGLTKYRIIILYRAVRWRCYDVILVEVGRIFFLLKFPDAHTASVRYGMMIPIFSGCVIKIGFFLLFFVVFCCGELFWFENWV